MSAAGSQEEAGEPSRVSLVVPIHNNAATIPRIVPELLAQLDRIGDGELVVVDDGSKDAPERVLASVMDHPRLRYLRSERNLGSAAARNRGIEAARGRIIVFSDGDCVPCADFVAAHLAAHERHPEEHFVVLGSLRYPPEVGVTPLMRLGNVVEFWDAPSSFVADDGNGLDPVSSDFTLFRTTNISAKKSFLSDRFRESIGAASGWEDQDLGLRLAARGMAVVVAKGAVSWHHHFLTPEQFLEKTFRYGVLFKAWLSHLPPTEQQEVRARLSYHLDWQRPLGRANLQKLKKRILVNALTIHPLRWLARWLEPRNEQLSASLYWKTYPHVFLRGYRGKPIAGIGVKLPSGTGLASAGKVPGGSSANT